MSRAFSDDSILAIWTMRSKGASLAEIAAEFRVSRQFIHLILLRKRYGDVDIPDDIYRLAKDIPFRIKRMRQKRDTVIRLFHDKGLTQREIREKLNIGGAVVSRAINKPTKE